MAEDGADLVVKVAGAISAVDAAEWDACAGDANPFVGHTFLKILEDSGSVGGRTGWVPQHVLVADRDGRLLACAPAYLKAHSYGEYVFDHAWAHAYEQAGGRYYPKLQVAVPFTPVPGPRLLVRPGPLAATARATLVAGIEAVAAHLKVSSAHITFLDEAAADDLVEADWLHRSGQQFHWTNHGYRSFDDFLDRLASRKRKAIRRERREVADSGTRIEVVTGDALTADDWDDFFRLYIAVSDRKWGYPYLTRAFFDLLGERMADRVVLVLAAIDGHRVAGALNLIGADTLYGRNWGADGEFRFLHFEVCYYQAIDFAIARGLARVEAGAQGTHKVQRGYLPVRTHSVHWIRDPGLRDAVADFLDKERQYVDWEMAEIGDTSPFRKDAPADACAPTAETEPAGERPPG